MQGRTTHRSAVCIPLWSKSLSRYLRGGDCTMIWITRLKHNKILDTHYYIGLKSICGEGIIGNEDYTYKSSTYYTRCKYCIKMYKSNTIYKKINEYRIKIVEIQEHFKRYFESSLQQMILNLLSYDNRQNIILSVLYDTFAAECKPHILECIILQMIIDKQIILEENVIKSLVLGVQQ